ncbi:MAG: 4-(cytidine 5'-diphospho)-2-C-methyl-D-erythritol kinase, partial [Muribaculaceae bacterium]|nr:4-(cytidine 5'-diphospho)-2-C-methyl-D-erythritol kinase [Muribaculaceae bacterium]
GGGSADAAFTLMVLNDLFEIGLGKGALAELASSLGADCPFFIYNKPMLAEGIGERLTEVKMPEFGGYIVVVKPQRSVSTAQAYGHVEIASPPQKLSDMISSPVSLWKSTGIRNGFEQSVVTLLPEVEEIKRKLIDAGAIYTSMSGSGSAVYGLFTDDKKSQQAVRKFTDMSVYFSPLLFGTR